MNKETIETTVISPKALLDHWQGHRRLTRRMIEVFPEDKLFSYSLGGMRTFAEFIMEFLGMAVPAIKGVVTGEWQKPEDLLHHKKGPKPSTKKELLQQWDETTEELNRLWSQITPERFTENDKAFGQWEAPVYTTILYLVDNEIHHRGQAYVYLRSLGIEPPPFWDRS